MGKFFRSFIIGTSLAFALLLAANACKSKGATPEKSSGIEVQFKNEVFVKGFKGCQPKGKDCTYLKVAYPKFIKASSPEVLQKLNQEVKNNLLEEIMEKKPAILDALAQELFSNTDLEVTIR